MVNIDETAARLNAHEQVCAIRYEGLCARLKRLESISITVAGFIIGLLVTIVLRIN